MVPSSGNIQLAEINKEQAQEGRTTGARNCTDSQPTGEIEENFSDYGNNDDQISGDLHLLIKSASSKLS